jgi:hypothetical protein
MDAFRFLISTSAVLGAILGAMSYAIFHLPAMASGGIGVSTMIGLFMIMLVFNNITYNRSMRYS